MLAFSRLGWAVAVCVLHVALLPTTGYFSLLVAHFLTEASKINSSKYFICHSEGIGPEMFVSLNMFQPAKEIQKKVNSRVQSGLWAKLNSLIWNTFILYVQGHTTYCLPVRHHQSVMWVMNDILVSAWTCRMWCITVTFHDSPCAFSLRLKMQRRSSWFLSESVPLTVINGSDNVEDGGSDGVIGSQRWISLEARRCVCALTGRSGSDIPHLFGIFPRPSYHSTILCDG